MLVRVRVWYRSEGRMRFSQKVVWAEFCVREIESLVGSGEIYEYAIEEV